MISPVSLFSPQNNVTNLYAYRLNRRAAMPEVPVTPVRATPQVYSETAKPVNLGSAAFSNAYYADQAGRARVVADLQGGGFPANTPQTSASETVPGTVLPDAYPAEQAARMRTSYPDLPGTDSLPGHEGVDTEAALGAEGAQQAADEGRCQTCEERKYQDGSDDPSVSYQTPTNIDPSVAASAVRGHEMEHVAHEQAKAQREGRKVVSQTVTMHTDICPECGRVYVSGGTTRTVTKADNAPQTENQPADQPKS